MFDHHFHKIRRHKIIFFVSLIVFVFVFGTGMYFGYSKIYLNPVEQAFAVGCGDGTIGGLEACDDGGWCGGIVGGTHCTTDGVACAVGSCLPASGDGCTAGCQLESSICGNNLFEWDEMCDDGKHCTNGTACNNHAECSGIGDNQCLPRNGDDCNSVCQLECGTHDDCSDYGAVQSPCVCTEFDDPVNGCYFNFLMPSCEVGGYCGTSPAVGGCSIPQAPFPGTGGGPVCSNGAIEPPETCDDDDDNNNDMCPDGAGGTCIIATCGDGFLCSDGGCTTGPGSGVEECENDGHCTVPGETCNLATCDCTVGTPPSPTCDNDGTDDGASETCNNCPYDVRCAADEKCLAGDTCSSASWECKREVICGDGWVNGEECDDGGICTALPLQTTMYEGMNCKDIDPSGNLLAGVARCRATGGICVAQDGDGCSWDCQDECKPDGSPCVGGSECCGSSACVDGVCGPELCEDDGDTCCVGTCDASGAGDGSCTGGKSCCKTGCSTPEICDNDIDDDGDSKIDCADEDCPDGSVCDTDRWCLELSCNPTITGTCSLTPCPGSCSVTADKWSFTVGGITDASPGCSGGGDCSQFVGSFSIEYRGGFSPGPTMCSTECEWCWENDLGGCEGGAAVWNIGYNEPSGKWRLYADTAAVYEAATWNCLGDNTFNRISFDSDLCAGWPDTIEVTPADKWRECGN